MTTGRPCSWATSWPFVVALLAIKFFIDFVAKYGFRHFGYYRIALSVGIAIALLAGAHISLS